MRLPDGVQQIVTALYTRHLDLATGTDDQRRALTQMIVEQTVYTYPHEGWGWKSADPGRPLSKDSIAKQQDGRLMNFDLFNGSTRKPNDHPESEDITGQTFRPWPGVDHLGTTAPDPEPDPDPGPVPEPLPSPNTELLQALLVRLAALERDAVRYGLRVYLTTDNGSLVSAEGGGGGDINASRPPGTNVGGWESFRVGKA
jgi:hypothetical protein